MKSLFCWIALICMEVCDGYFFKKNIPPWAVSYPNPSNCLNGKQRHPVFPPKYHHSVGLQNCLLELRGRQGVEQECFLPIWQSKTTHSCVLLPVVKQRRQDSQEGHLQSLEINHSCFAAASFSYASYRIQQGWRAFRSYRSNNATL